ncbi:MAG: glycosyltransferase family 117 protein [Anaerolineae bacterium]
MNSLRNLRHALSSRPFPLALLILAGALALYVSTLAPGTIFGDPSEYQFIPAIWGIAHPPGYAFYTLVAGCWQRLVAIGSVAYRTNLLAAFAGGWIATRVVLMVLDVANSEEDKPSSQWFSVAAFVAGMGVVLTPDLWQHSIHANAHVVSAAITMTQLWVLVRWDRSDRERWLYALAFLIGLGVTQHPITIWGVPAYGLFVLLRRPRTLLKPRTLGLGLAAGLAGLLPWLYLWFRSASTPFGPSDMGTWEGFLRHATAQGLRVNLFHFGPADQFDRLQVFVTLLRLQYGWVQMGLIVLGLVWLGVVRPKLAILWAGFLLGHVGFTMNTVQDVMAYLLHPFAALGLPLGLGVLVLVRAVTDRRRWSLFAVVGVLLVLVARGVWLFPRVSLREWDDADRFISMLRDRFADQSEGAAFVSDWEHLTPYFYYQYVEGQGLEREDLRPVYVTGDTPWVESVFENLPLGPVYLSNYRRDVRELSFRVRPSERSGLCLEADLWQVVEPNGLSSMTPQHELADAWVGDRLQLLGFDLPHTEVAQGAIVPVVLYATVPQTETEILMPYAHVGPGLDQGGADYSMEQRWTTDSRRLTPEWRPAEVIVECYEIFLPYDLPPGRYPLRLGYWQMTGDAGPLAFASGERELLLGTLEVVETPGAGQAARGVGRALTNIGNEVALRTARTWAGMSLRRQAWDEPLDVRAGQPIHLKLVWEVLSRPRTSYTVFIHLIDAQGQPWYVHDYTPLGGAYPSYLWFPKWLKGQRVADPYRLVLPEDLPEGTYWLEVGLYEMGSVRRIPQLAADGTMTGDRFVLGPVSVSP